jgi:hypothetical protein
MATWWKTDGTYCIKTPKKGGGKPFTLEELQESVAGWIEVLTLDEDTVMVINEEGKLRNLPINDNASGILAKAFPGRLVDVIVGDVLVCSKKELGE